ncbi:MAG TPA: tRNA (adenosine(37)-N6)-threonylcarbamoyltransferase complex ATPase subunit type 1 TsaE [Atopostipes sp.]|nr:tRNA (adenosine(37)-N6)-threonylcarbamoyltransferase complex ATPase subunit type 1 TsaE [Atopostipes sp.]
MNLLQKVWGIMTTIVTENEQETKAFAKKLTEYLKPGMTILLKGDLGAGKTTFTKGIGEGLGIQRIIKSPTYTIVREYQDGKYPLYHVDLYRLTESEVPDLGLDEYFEGEGITVVEWPSVAPEDLPLERLEVELAPDIEAPEKRTITVHAIGKDYEQLLHALDTSQKE